MFTKSDLAEFAWTSLSAKAAANPHFGAEAFDPECGILLKTGEIGAAYDQLV
jgi:hypothetical protein